MGRISELDLLIKEGSLDDPLYVKYRNLSQTESAKKTESAEIKPGISVDIRERYLAMTAIMACYSKLNKINGMHSENGYKNAEHRYGSDISTVIGKMDKKGSHIKQEIDENINVLIARDAMEGAGFSGDAIKSARYKLRTDLNNQYGPGNAYSSKRNDFLKHINKGL